MKTYDNARLESGLKRAAAALTPEQADALWETPVERADGSEWFLEERSAAAKNSGRKKWLASVTAMAACLAIAFFSYYEVALRSVATVYLDVNPSVTLEINRHERVTAASANNADGEMLLSELSLKRMEVDDAVDALVASMVAHGFLSAEKNVVLVSVDGDESQALQLRLSTDIDQYLSGLVGSVYVFDMSVSSGDDLEDLAEQYYMSQGKAALIRSVVQAHPELDFDQLASMNMTELARYLFQEGIDLRDFAHTPNVDLDDLFDDTPYEDYFDDIDDVDDDDDDFDDIDDDDDYDDDDYDDIDDDDDYDDDDYDDIDDDDDDDDDEEDNDDDDDDGDDIYDTDDDDDDQDD